MTEDKKCLNCSRMTVSQDEYISGMQEKIHDLEKENAELKEKQRVDRQCEACKLGDLIVENAELKKDKEYLDNTNNEQTEVILKLSEQIEKMKRCSNCSFNFGGCKFVLRIKDDVTPFVKLHKDLFCINYDKWEYGE